jgi:hypothetical protein
VLQQSGPLIEEKNLSQSTTLTLPIFHNKDAKIEFSEFSSYMKYRVQTQGSMESFLPLACCPGSP